MLINCPHCEASYRIDSTRIPEKDSFVRCTKCSKTIPISGTGEEDAQDFNAPEVITECEECKSRYSVPLSMFKSDKQKVRCGKCSHTFKMDRSGNHLPEDENQEETAIDESFDSLPELPAENESDQYLESISLAAIDENDEEESELELSTLSIDEKSKFFLEPAEENQETEETEEVQSEQWPDILDERELESSELDEISGQISLEDQEEEEEEESSDLMELENPSTNELEIKPDSDIEKEDKKEVGEEVEKKSKKGPVILLVCISLVLVGAFYWSQNKKSEQFVTSIPQSEEIQSKLSINEPLDGQYIEGEKRSKRLFLIEGWIKNPYPKNIKVRKILIKGALYGPENNKLTETFSYAGKKLEISQIEKRSDKNVKKYFQKVLDEKKSKQLLRANRPIPFQIAFAEAPGDIQKLEARIISFEMEGEPIILEE